MTQNSPGVPDEPGRAATAAETPAGPPRHRDGSQRRPHPVLAVLKEIGTIVVVALVLSFLIKTFLFRAYFIPSGSMENTLQVDDRIFVNLLVPEPFPLQRGDVVVFQDTKNWLGPVDPGTQSENWMQDALVFVGLMPDNSEQHLVKRVIGLPGDRVACCSADGSVTVNGEPLDEPYLYPGASPSDIDFEVVVPEGSIWVMGDHRDASADSRLHMEGDGAGFVDLKDVEGRAAVVAWPLDHWSILGNYPDVFGSVPEPAGAGAGRADGAENGQ